MNENILEKFKRGKKAVKPEPQQAAVWTIPQQLNPKIAQYFEAAKKKVDGGPWLDCPEIPSSSEILDLDTDGSSSSDAVKITANRPKGAWESKEAYLCAHYELLREDAVRPLREAVSQVRITPTANEDAFNGAIGIYEKVHICGITCSTRGIAIQVTFSLLRTGKKILWEQSKRLITGSLVVLTPRSDMFKSKAIVATVAARPLAALQQNPPEVDLFIARAQEQELDPAEEFVMVEDRGGLYEADRHTLLALQRMMREPFPLSEHLVSAQSPVSAPEYVQKMPMKDLSSIFKETGDETFENVDILKGWPNQQARELDNSQLSSLRRILTKRLAIVQGPPGTGKTFVSVEAIRVLLANHKPGDPPIIIACQTNGAIDQLLRHISKFESDFVRLGGRSKDKDVIKQRTLYEVKKQTSENPVHGSLAPKARKKMKNLANEIGLLLLPLKSGPLPLDFRTLQNFGLLSECQADSLEAGASQWVQEQLSNPNLARSPFTIWLGKALVTVPIKQQPEEFGFDFEEADLEFEQLKELEAENVVKDDEDFESLSGERFGIADNFTCNRTIGTTEAKVKEVLKEQDMWMIREAARPAVYRYLQSELKKIILASLRDKTKTFNEQAIDRRVGNWERDENILKQQKVIGMTTTGLSKYRGLIAALEPKIVLIEEAAEILEAPVTVACLPSLHHLILVGDHQQLRPYCRVRALEDKPFYLNVSLFERLVRNKVEFSTLRKQRRMIPELRRMLHPIYKDVIEDHPSVRNPEKRPDVAGMGGVNSYFFTHFWPEHRDEQMSAYNPEEADMIVGFVEYLHYNAVPMEEITVLTFYNGQRKRLLKQLRERASLRGQVFNVVTVDSYQGEENTIVILSLVRSNGNGQIGFLANQNRVCVALSRAKCGFYIFGNGFNLYKHEIWEKVIKIIGNKGSKKDRLKTEPLSRIDETLPIRCKNHNNVTSIGKAADFDNIYGGCAVVKCTENLPCGHPCGLSCHPFSHEAINCQHACEKELPCGHKCELSCQEICECKTCAKANAPARDSKVQPEAFDGKETLSQASSSESWQSFSEVEPGRYAVAISTPSSQRKCPEKKDGAVSLVNLTLDDGTEIGQRQPGFDLDGTNSRSSSISLIEETVVANGTRTKRKERFMSSVDEPVKGHQKDWSKEASLLD